MYKRKAYLENDMFVKVIDFDIDDYWLEWYQKLHSYEPRVVEVYGYNDRKIYMEYIDGDQMFSNANYETYAEMLDIGKRILDFSRQNNVHFYHHDWHFGNFLIENETRRMVLVDPDSFHLFANGKWV
jgi:thiamine kinase-like enzyme